MDINDAIENRSWTEGEEFARMIIDHFDTVYREGAESGDNTTKKNGGQRDRGTERQDERVDANLAEPGEGGRNQAHEDPRGHPRKPEAHEAAGPGQHRDLTTDARAAHGDRVIAYAGCVLMREEVKSDPRPNSYPPGTIGHQIGLNDVKWDEGDWGIARTI